MFQVTNTPNPTVEYTTQWLDGKFNVITGAFTQAASKYGHATLDLVLNYARIDAINHLITGFFWLLMFITAIIIFIIFIKKAAKENNELFFAIGVSSLILSFGSFLATVTILLNVWNWVGIDHPEIYLVHQGIVMYEDSQRNRSN